MKTSGLAALAIALLPSVAAAQYEGLEEGARTISQADFEWRVGVMAHDSMQGRGTPSPGLDMTAEWVASEFRRLGLRGGAEGGSFIQRYPLQTREMDTERSTLAVGGSRLAFGADLLPLFGGIEEGEAAGGLVLVSGSGTVGRGVQRSVRGHHAVLVRAAGAGGVDRAAFQLAAALRAAGALSVLVTNDEDEEAWGASADRAFRPSVTKGWEADGARGRSGGSAFAPMVQIRTASLVPILQARGLDLASLARRSGDAIDVREVADLQVTLIQRTRDGSTSAPNVVGILEGSDPDLMHEYVVLSGHMDHVGVGTPDESGDSIYNGADDDASGTAAVLEVAEAMASLETAPRRSMVFLVVSGEEKGLWGSEWYAENPTVPLDAMVADLNADMVGRNWPDTIVAIGKEHSDLGTTLERVNAAHPEIRMTAIDDIWPEERFYFRSDHFNFARKGVPILFFFNGTHDDYHRPSDEPDRIDGEKAARIAQLLYWLGIEIANTTERPQWNPESYARIVSDDR
jgi:hypothetical protein